MFEKVYDKDIGKDDLLGLAEVPLDGMFGGGFRDLWLQLVKKAGFRKWNSTQGHLHVQVWCGYGAEGEKIPRKIPISKLLLFLLRNIASRSSIPTFSTRITRSERWEVLSTPSCRRTQRCIPTRFRVLTTRTTPTPKARITRTPKMRG